MVKLDEICDSIFEEMCDIWQEKEKIVAWINQVQYQNFPDSCESHSNPSNSLLQILIRKDEELREYKNHLNIEFMGKDQNLLEEILSVYDSYRDDYNKVIIHLNACKSHLFDYLEKWSIPDRNFLIKKCSKKRELEKIYQNFQISAEIIDDMQVELENAVMMAQRQLKETKRTYGYLSKIANKSKINYSGELLNPFPMNPANPEGILSLSTSSQKNNKGINRKPSKIVIENLKSLSGKFDDNSLNEEKIMPSKNKKNTPSTQNSQNIEKKPNKPADNLSKQFAQKIKSPVSLSIGSHALPPILHTSPNPVRTQRIQKIDQLLHLQPKDAHFSNIPSHIEPPQKVFGLKNWAISIPPIPKYNPYTGELES